MKLTDSMKFAMEHIRRDGFVFAGRNSLLVPDGPRAKRGWRRADVTIQASVLLGLERRGLVTCSPGPDGGMCARIVEAPGCPCGSDCCEDPAPQRPHTKCDVLCDKICEDAFQTICGNCRKSCYCDL